MNRWYVVNTQPQKEERARDHLQRQGFQAYLPRWRRRRSHARRIDWVAAPLFPRYLFVGFDIDITRWRAIHSTMGVSHLVCSDGLPLPVPEGIVEHIRSREASNGLIEIKPSFHKGQPIAIDAGPLLDQVGLFECMNDEERAVILLGLLGREIRLTVPVNLVRAVA